MVIEVTTRHIVWMPGDTAEEAVKAANYHPWYELAKAGENDAFTSAEVRAPNEWDWDEVYERSYFGSYPGLECDAHVEAHHAEALRQKWAAEKTACAAAGHPNTDTPLSDGRVWCVGCREYLPVLASTGA